MTPSQFALTAACQLHKRLLNDDLFMGYDGEKESFDQLFDELVVIARSEVSLEVEPVDQIIDTWYQYQYEIMEGDREPCWFL